MAKFTTHISRLLISRVITATCISHILEPGLALVSLSREDHEKSTEGCMENCELTHQRLTCNDCIPGNVTTTVNEIVLTNFNSSHFTPQTFCGVSWPRVMNLTIVDNYNVKYYEVFGIGNFTFDCLHQIESLKLKFSVLQNFSRNAFYGLDNVRVLDLTGCIRLQISGLTPGLSLDTNVPRLQTLIISSLGSAYDGIKISQEFIDNLGVRNIHTIDMSSTTVGLRSPSLNLSPLCKSLRTWILAYSHILHMHFDLSSPCYSLRVLDLSGATFPGSTILTENKTIHVPPPDILKFDSPYWNITFRTVSVIYLNTLISPDHFIYLNNVTFQFEVENSLTEIHLSGYNVPVFEANFKIKPNHVEYLDMSNNKIERLSPDFSAYLEHLKRIDVSNNRLAKRLDNTFSHMFRNNANLEIVQLSLNGFTTLPPKMFERNNALKRIHLSKNDITQIPFEISHLDKLELLDLNGNAVEYLDGWSRDQIDMLKRRKQEQKIIDRKAFTIDLRDNAFSCKCHSLEFIKWFVHSPVFKDSLGQYFCELDGKRLSLNTGAIDAAQYDCDKPRRETRRLLFIILLPCASTGTLVVLAIVLFKQYKNRKRLRRIREQVYLLQENESDYRFPVFLSYASEDSEFVEPNILQPLEAHLRNLINCDRNLVAIGDRYFRLGRSIFAEIIRMLEDCAVIVVVLSKNYCNSDYCKHEIEQARLMRKPIVIIMKERVDEGDMNGVIKETFKHFTRATFRFDKEGLRLDQNWDYICHSIIQLF